MYDIGVVTGTWNRIEYLKKMIASVRASINPGIRYTITLVDGGSTDGTVEWASHQPDIKFIQHGTLRGAIATFNDGARETDARYLIFGNDDLTFVGDSITRALAFMQSNPDVGIGAFWTDRQGGWQVAGMSAIAPDGRPISVPYNGVSIFSKWFGERLGYWSLENAKTYGGDCALVARCLEAGWKAVALPPECGVHETIPHDELNKINNDRPEITKDHPDTLAYRAVYPHGPQIRAGRLFEAPDDFKQPMKILYAPIYEENHVLQHEQKYGLRRALMRIGAVYEVDYLKTGPDSILKAADLWRPHLIVLQLHGPDPFTAEHMRLLRARLPDALIVSWNGDVHDLTTVPREQRTKDGKESVADAYVRMLRLVDLHTVVNEHAMRNYRARGVTCRYWQIGYEPEGVGHEPLATEERHDVVFLGNGYSASRQQFGDFLKTLTCRLAVYGAGWPHLQAQPATTYDFRQGCRVYRAARLALGDSEWATTARGFVSNRAFQALAAGGALMLQQWFDGAELIGLIDGKHWVLWTDYADLRDKIAYYLNPVHERERAMIAAAGHVEVLLNHTFEKRVSELLGMLGEIQVAKGASALDWTNADPTLSIFHKETRRA